VGFLTGGGKKGCKDREVKKKKKKKQGQTRTIDREKGTIIVWRGGKGVRGGTGEKGETEADAHSHYKGKQNHGQK